MKKALKIWNTAKIPLCAAITVIAWFVPMPDIASLILFIAALVIIGYEYVIKAVKTVIRGRILDENLLMLIASVGAFVLGEYPEGIAVLLLGTLGEMFEDYAVNRSRRDVATLLSIRPSVANVMRGGEFVEVDPEEVEIGEIILVKAGERVPIDGVINKGSVNLDTSALTGESVPRKASAGQEVLSGCIVKDGVIEVKTTKKAAESAIAVILEMVENALGKKAKTESFISKFARFYTPIVVGLAVIVAVIPPIIDKQWSQWIYRALNFLVVSCPCALVISIPLAFFNTIGFASKRGILIKGSGFVERLAKVNTVLCDKTGTVTRGNFVVTKILADDVEEVASIAKSLELNSNHPIAKAISERGKKSYPVEEIEEISGCGIKGKIGDKTYYLGSPKLMNIAQVTFDCYDGNGAAVYLSDGKKHIATFVIADEIKETSKEAVERLKGRRIKTKMLSGDNASACRFVAEEVGIDEYVGDLLPTEKLEILDTHLNKKNVVAFVGDGINDAPALAKADVGIAMGKAGSDIAIEAADVVIMRDDLRKIDEAVALSRFNMRLVIENIVFALGVKLAVLVLSVLGYANIWMAIFGDVGVSVLCILNSMRRKRLG